MQSGAARVEQALGVAYRYLNRRECTEAEMRARLGRADIDPPEVEQAIATLLEQGIGVSNVNERLKVLFGNQYRMWIDSQPDGGTRVQIEMPELQTDLAAAS